MASAALAVPRRGPSSSGREPVPFPRWFAFPEPIDQLTKKGRLMPGGAQLMLLCYLARELSRDDGARRRAREGGFTAAIAMKDMARFAGVDERTIRTVIADAIERGLIKRKRDRGTREFCYALCPEAWSAAPAYVPKAQELNDEPEADTEDDGDVEAAAAASVEVVTPEAPLMLKPGVAARPAPLKRAAPVREVEVTNTTRDVLAITSLAICSGRLQIRLSGELSSVGEQKAKQTGRGHPVFGRAGAHSGSEQEAKHTGRGLPVSRSAPSQNHRLSEIAALIDPFLLETAGKPSDADLRRAIAKRLGDAPIAAFERVARARVRRGGNIEPGLFILLADDARRAHEAVSSGLGQARAAAAAAPASTAEQADDWGSVTRTEQCRHCGGRREFYSSGRVSECRCAKEAALTRRKEHVRQE